LIASASHVYSSLQNITLHVEPCVRLTLNCCSFPVSAHVSVLAASLLPFQLFGAPFLWAFVVVAPLTVFGANSKLSSITLLSGLLNAPPHPAPQIRRVFRRHCALYKFTYLLTYIINIPSVRVDHKIVARQLITLMLKNEFQHVVEHLGTGNLYIILVYR